MFDERWSADVTDVTTTLRSLLEDECSESVVRAAEESEAGWSPEVDSTLRGFGLYEVPADAEMLAAIAIELGRALAPVPWPEVAAVQVALGREDAAYALDGASPLGPAHAIVRAGSGATSVPNEGPHARSGGGDVLVRIDPADVAATYDEELTSDLSSMMRLLAAARIVGASARLLEIGVEYAKERHAFGKPIGAYQAVSHKLADAAIAVEGAELLVKKTAYLARRAGEGACPSRFFATMVWSNAVEAGRLVARYVHQCMGGFGSTLEYPAQLYSRRIRSWALRLGRPGEGYQELGRRVLDRAQREQIVGLWHEQQGIRVPRWVREIDLLPTPRP